MKHIQEMARENDMKWGHEGSIFASCLYFKPFRLFSGHLGSGGNVTKQNKES